MAKMIDRPESGAAAAASGLGAEPTPAYQAQEALWEERYAAGKRRHGPGSGAVDRTISDLPLKPIYGPPRRRAPRSGTRPRPAG